MSGLVLGYNKMVLNTKLKLGRAKKSRPDLNICFESNHPIHAVGKELDNLFGKDWGDYKKILQLGNQFRGFYLNSFLSFQHVRFDFEFSSANIISLWEVMLNAVAYGGGVVEISAYNHLRGNHFFVFVKDFGPGLEQQILNSAIGVSLQLKRRGNGLPYLVNYSDFDFNYEKDVAILSYKC